MAIAPFKKFGVVSHVLPPAPSGQSMVLLRLLNGLPKDGYCLISSGRKPMQEEIAGSESLDADLFHLTKVRQLPPSRVPILSVLFICVNTVWAIWRRSRQIEEIARRERCEMLVGCTGDFYDLPATFIACQRLGITFVPYIFDDYAYQWLGFRRRIAKIIEPLLLRSAAAVIVPNEYLQKEYATRHGIDSVVIHNPCLIPDLKKLDDAKRIFDSGINIVYTGAIYHAHYDAFVNLIAALQRVGRPDIRLHLFTAQSEAELADHGIAGAHVVHHAHVAQIEINNILRQADILFLPLAFASPIKEVIKTSAPGKTGEYLAVGRPVLVHCMPGCFISWYFMEHHCGIVVDEYDAETLAAAVEALVANEELRSELGARARAKAQTDFDVVVVQSRFSSLLGHLADCERYV